MMHYMYSSNREKNDNRENIGKRQLSSSSPKSQ